jgi:uncharacterized protein
VSPPEAPALGPTSGAERIHSLDAMRGVAILGVLLAYAVWSLGNPPEETWNAADRAVERGMNLLVDGKFLTMFACLFGVGVAQQWRRWEAAGSDPRPLHLRRMGFLLGIGLLHAVFLRNGDILVPYALLGFVLLLVRRVPSPALATAAAVLLAAPVLFERLLPALGLAWPARPGAIPGGYLAENIAWLRYWSMTNPLLGWPRILAVMLLGVLIGRARLVERLSADPALAWHLLAAAAPLSVLTRMAHDLMAGRRTGAPIPLAERLSLDLLSQAGVMSLAATYALVLLLLRRSARGLRALGPVRTLGRMAFTNYLLQAVLLVPFCLAFDLFDTIRPLCGVWLALAVGLVQTGFSVLWLERHALGPLERVWRTVTYGSGRGGR